MTRSKATIVACDEVVSRKVHERFVTALRGEGPGELAVFDRGTSSARAFAWLYRTEAPRDRAIAVLSALGALPDTAIYTVDAVDVHGDGHAPPPNGRSGQPLEVAGIRKVTFHRRRAGTTIEEYVRRFGDHGPLAAVHHANACRYRQNVVVDYTGPADRHADGISEHWYPSIHDATLRHFARPDSSDVVGSDVAQWLDRSTAIAGYARVWHWSPA